MVMMWWKRPTQCNFEFVCFCIFSSGFLSSIYIKAVIWGYSVWPTDANQSEYILRDYDIIMKECIGQLADQLTQLELLTPRTLSGDRGLCVFIVIIDIIVTIRFSAMLHCLHSDWGQTPVAQTCDVLFIL